MDFKRLVILLITVTVLAAVVLEWNNRRITSEVPDYQVEHQEKAESLGGTIYDQGSNPVGDQLPDTNPLSGIVNPFDTYKNPFETQ